MDQFRLFVPDHPLTRGMFPQVSAVIFGFLNVARALVPVRIALTLGTAPLVDKYIIKPFNLDKKKEDGADSA